MVVETLKPVRKNPRCYFCKQEVTQDFYCYGCGEFICEECEIAPFNPPCGEHSVKDHKIPVEERTCESM